MSQRAIELRNVSFKRFEQQILHSLSLRVATGEFVVLIGPNGSGKSTLAKVINGLIKPSTGEVCIAGMNIVGRPIYEIANRVATLTQDLHHSTFSELSVAMNMQLALSRGASEEKCSKNHSWIVDYLGTFNQTLGARLDVQAGQLSGGQRQALALAMCFAHRPEVLLLDEHTSALDPKAAQNLMVLTNAHILKEGLTTIMITHSLEHALEYGSRLIAMNEGRVVLDVKGAEKAALTKNELIAKAY